LPGALPPSFPLKVDGVTSGQKLGSKVTLAPNVGQDVPLAKVEYNVDGTVIQTVTTAPFSLAFDPGTLEPGNHILKVTAVDTAGRQGSLQVPFASSKAAPPSKGGGSSPLLPLMAILLLAVVGGLGYRIYKKRAAAGGDSSRSRAWSGRVPLTVRGSRDSTAFTQDAREEEERLQGRIILMDTRKNGQGGGVRQYELRGSPLSFGTGNQCDIRVEDNTGEIGNEEARIWVQKKRLVYHKLTTLSAMATEGMVSGWVFLDNGEELHVGSYRMVYRAEVPAEEAEEPVADVSMPA
jgi:hypothetical protein